MSKKDTLHIIYVSGFGSRYDSVRHFLLRFWRLYGVNAELASMRWNDGSSYETKMDLLNRLLDKNRDKKVVLIGESAGASIVINAYANRTADIHRAMTLCGKNRGAKTVASRFYSKSPAFKDSIYAADINTEKLSKSQRANITSIYSLYDSVIPTHESITPGSREVRLWAFGHLTSILLGLSLFSFILVREAKR